MERKRHASEGDRERMSAPYGQAVLGWGMLPLFFKPPAAATAAAFSTAVETGGLLINSGEWHPSSRPLCSSC